MIFLGILLGLTCTLLATNLLIYCVRVIFHLFSYKLTPAFYYILSALIVIIIGLLVGLCTIGVAGRFI